MRKSHKEELFSVAFRLFILDSFDGVSIPDIEKASGYTRGAIFYYADTKLDLFKKVMEHYVIEKQSIDNKVLSTDMESRQKIAEISLLDFIDIYVDAVKKTMENLMTVLDPPVSKVQASRAYLKMFIQIADLLPDLHERQLFMMEREKEVWQTVLTNAVKRGEIKESIDVDMMANVFINLFCGRAYATAVKDGIEPEILRKEMKAVYELMR